MVNKNKKKLSRKKSMSYEEQRELETNRKVKIFSLFLLIVMGASVIGFSVFNPTIGGSGADGSRNVPFTQGLFQDGAGGTFDGAIINGIQFIFFEDLTPYRNDDSLIELSNNLLENKDSSINVFVDEGFINDNARFLISQALQVNSITTIPTQNLSCSENPTLVYTTNSTNLAINNSITNCMIFESSSVEAQSLSNGLVYHLIKDIR